MKLVQVTIAQAVRLMDQTNHPEAKQQKYYLVDAVRAVQDRYKFLQVPRTVEDFNFGTGLKFFRGWFKPNIVIDKLEIYANGMICESALETEVIDEFLDDFSAWIQTEYELQPLTGARAYLSNIEVQSDKDFGARFSFLSEIGQTITAMLQSYGQKPNPYLLRQFGFHAETTNVPFPIATGFTFDRRAGKPDADQLYFCSAPLKTADQLQILERLEAIL